MKIKIVTSFACALLLMSCQDMFEPKNENISSFDRVYKDPGFAEGLLISAYARIPTNSLSFNDVATDDAVTNDKNNGFLRMATGEWSALYNPVNRWTECNAAMIYLDQLINIIDTVEWKWSNSEINSLYVKRFYGEAYALRGVIQYNLLQTVAGYDASGKLLGIPFYKDDGNFNIPRASFEESVNQIYNDFDKALEYLTMDDYKNIASASELPPGYSGISVDNYNEVFGKELNQRISGRVVKAYKARLALLAASPAFSPNNDITLWQRAANYAGQVLETIGGVSGLDPNGHRFYDGARVDAISLASGVDQKEIIWRRHIVESNSREASNFPPSLFGNGNVNPTQNLVDAFPMANGIPIKELSSGYNASTPYSSRDPRLALYIAYNGNTVSGQTIYTGVGGKENAKDSIATSTRTGYYLKKLLREDVNLNPTGTTTRKHYEVHMRYTELFLIYAEAANEAWGPDGTGSFSFSAKDVIAAIRKRAGITQPDSYLASITTKEQMRELIRNERRLELCFEGSRFWDLRRWKSDLTETAKGININGNSMTVVNVENRLYNNEYMHYGPLPETELTKFNALEQNKGW
jgi:SusD family.